MSAAAVVGLGIYQVPLIKFLRSCGFSILGISPKGDYPGLKLVDELLPIDVRDISTVKSAIIDRSLDFDFAVTAGSDLGVPMVNFLNSTRGNASLTEDMLSVMTNKEMMKEWFQETGIKTPKLLYASKGADDSFPPFIAESVVKGLSSSGSAEVWVCRTPEKLSSVVELLHNQSKDFLIEEYCHGIEFGAQLVVHDNRIENIFVHDDWMAGEFQTVPVGHRYPSQFSRSIVFETCQKIASYGPKSGIYNLDFIYSNGEAFLLEMGFRAGATGIPEITKAYYGIDLYRKATELTLGRTIEVLSEEIQREQLPVSYSILWSPSDVLLTSEVHEQVYELLHNRPEVISFEIDFSSGRQVEGLKSGRNRFGHVLSKDLTSEWSAVEIAKQVSSIVSQ